MVFHGASDVEPSPRSPAAVAEGGALRLRVDDVAEAAFVCERGEIVRCNEAAERLLGSTREELIGTDLVARFARGDQEALAFLRDEGQATVRSPIGEAALVGAGGAPVHVDYLVISVLDRGEPAHLVLVRDVSDRWKEARALRVSEELLRTVFDNSPIGLEIFDRDTVLVKVNRRISEMFGVDPAEILGKFNLRADPNYRDPDVWAAIARGEEVRHEARFSFEKAEYQTTRQGEAVYDIIMTPVPASVSREIGYIMQVVDVTERRRAEEERARLQEELLQARRLESIGTLAAGVAHDFNNLLTGIIGPLSLLEESLGPDHPELANVRSMMGLAERGAGLTRQLLGFARQGRFDPQPLDLRRSVEDALTLFSRTHRSIAVRLDRAEGGPLVVVADRTQVDQVLLNLLTNAGDAMPDGGELAVGLGRVELAAEEAAREGVAAGPYAQLRVRDSGSGMDEETRRRVFEPFFTTKAAGRGTGLGLASVYGVVRKHEGYVTVWSEPGRGSEFVVGLPAAPAATLAPKPPAERVMGRGQVILVVDDEAAIRDETARMLTHLGYRPLRAGSGAEALELCAIHGKSIELVVLDLIMPSMGGRQVLDALRASLPEVAVLLASGWAAEGQVQDLLRRGRVGFLQKPYTLSALSADVAALLRG